MKSRKRNIVRGRRTPILRDLRGTIEDPVPDQDLVQGTVNITHQCLEYAGIIGNLEKNLPNAGNHAIITRSRETKRVVDVGGLRQQTTYAPPFCY